jgi:hypothetical protein
VIPIVASSVAIGAILCALWYLADRYERWMDAQDARATTARHPCVWPGLAETDRDE